MCQCPCSHMMATASFTDKRALMSIIAGAALCGGSTIALGPVISQDNISGNVALVVAVSVLLFGMGAGIGLGWAHLISLVLTRSDEADKAAASVNLIQSLGAAFGAAAAGVVANTAGLVEPGGVAGAIRAGFWLDLVAVVLIPVFTYLVGSAVLGIRM